MKGSSPPTLRTFRGMSRREQPVDFRARESTAPALSGREDSIHG